MHAAFCYRSGLALLDHALDSESVANGLRALWPRGTRPTALALRGIRGKDAVCPTPAISFTAMGPIALMRSTSFPFSLAMAASMPCARCARATVSGIPSFGCKRAGCDRCFSAGWVETGTDPVGFPDIEMSPEGHPQWTIRYDAPESAPDADPEGRGLAQT
jgi:hypothetical protein